MTLAEQIISDYKEAQKERKTLESQGKYIPTELLKRLAVLAIEILDNNLQNKIA